MKPIIRHANGHPGALCGKTSSSLLGVVIAVNAIGMNCPDCAKIIKFSKMNKLTIRRLSSGYVHIRGNGVCNWAQPPAFPCDKEILKEHIFAEAGEDFRQQLFILNENLMEGIFSGGSLTASA